MNLAKTPILGERKLNLNQTPTNDNVDKSKLAKTPMSTTRQRNMSVLQSATKKPQLTKPFRFDSQHLESNINFGAACQFSGASNGPPVTANPLLATSSFNRRKSYNPSESLARPLTYNPHMGKLKPMEISTRSVHVIENMRPNLNESVAIKTGNDKRKSIIMQRNIEKEKLGVKRKILRNTEMDNPRPI